MQRVLCISIDCQAEQHAITKCADDIVLCGKRVEKKKE